MWTEERIDALRKMWTEGRTASEIAKAIGHVTRSAVCGKAHRLKLESRTPVARATPGSGKHMRTLDQLRYMHTQTAPNLERRVLGKAIGKVGRSLVRETLGNLPAEPLPPRDTMPAQVSFNDLESKHCRAITVEHLPFNADRKIYCGERRVPGSSYCECHTRRYMTAISVVKAKQPDRPAWQDTRTGRKGAVFLSGREKMKAY